MNSPRSCILALALALLSATAADAPAQSSPSGPVLSAAHAPFRAFESGPVQPLLVTNDGSRLLVLNTADGRLEVFAIDDEASVGVGAGSGTPGVNGLGVIAAGPGSAPGVASGAGGVGSGTGVELVPVGSVFTGLEPVGIARHPTDPSIVFVSNALSDSVAVVDVDALRVVTSTAVGDEPAGLTVAGGRLYVATARAPAVPPAAGQADPGPFRENTLVVMRANPPYDVLTSRRIPAVKPRDVVFVDGTLYVVPQNSGNGTTILPFQDALDAGIKQYDADAFNPTIDLNPALLSPELSFPAFAPGWILPVTSKIVLDSEVPGVELPDADVIAFDPLTLQVEGAVQGVGTTLFDVEHNPVDGTLWVAATDANNRVRFEPVLKGDAVENRVSVVDPDTGDVDVLALEPPLLPRRQGQPVALEIGTGAFGSRAYVASHGTATVVVLDAATRTYVGEIATGELPAGLEVDDERGLLFVLSRGDTTVRAYDIAAGHALVASAPLGYDPEPPLYAAGRSHLYDSRPETGHGNGTMSCSACHIFGHHDASAWDLGDPGGSFAYFYPDLFGNIPGQTLLQTMVDSSQVVNNPLKGPMTTQSLRGLLGTDQAQTLPLHWRGDRRFFQMFRNAFVGLHGGTGITHAEMQEFAGFLRMLAFPPNPYQPRDREYTGIAALGRDVFGMNPAVPGKIMQVNQDFTCVSCHEGDFAGGTDFTGSNPGVNSSLSQMINMPTLRGTYEKEYMSLTGFGILHDGEIPGVRAFFESVQPQTGQTLAPNFTQAERDAVTEFVKQWDTGVSPLVGAQWAAMVGAEADTVAFLELAEPEAGGVPAQVDLTVKVWTPSQPDTTVGGLYRRVQGNFRYVLETGEVLTRGEFLQLLAQGSASALFTCVLPGTGERVAFDRDEDGLFDLAERAAGSDPTDPDSDDDGYTDGFESTLGADPTVFDASLPDATRPTLTEVAVLEVFADTATLSLVADEPVTLTADVTVVETGVTVRTVTGDGLRRRHDVVVDGLPAGVDLRAVARVADRNDNTSATAIEFTTRPPLLHVDDITLDASGSDPYDVVATVRVVDHTGAAVASVPVTGFWDGDIGGADWRQEAFTDATGTATFALPPFTPTVVTPITFTVAFIGSDEQSSPYFVGASTPDWVPGFFYEQSMNAANFRTVDLP